MSACAEGEPGIEPQHDARMRNGRITRHDPQALAKTIVVRMVAPCLRPVGVLEETHVE